MAEHGREYFPDAQWFSLKTYWVESTSFFPRKWSTVLYFPYGEHMPCISWRCNTQFVDWTYIQLWFFRLFGTRESMNSNIGCAQKSQSFFTEVPATGIFFAFLGAVLAPGLFLYVALYSDVELWFSMWPEIWSKHFPSHLYLPWLMAGIREGCCAATLGWASVGHFRLLWQRTEGFANRVGSVPACRPLECILQKVFLMRKISVDWRQRKKSNQNCRGDTLGFVFEQNHECSHETL